MSDPIDSPFLQPLEPTAQQQGVDVPGFYSSTTDFVNFGVYNGNFRVGPPDSSANLDVATSLSGSNFLPGWRFVQSSNTVVTAKIVNGSAQGAGSNLQFTHDASSTSGTSYIEQIIDVGGSAVGDIGATTRIEYRVRSGDWQIDIRRQYLASDGSIVGMPPEFQANTFSLTPTAAPESLDGDQADNNAPATARYLRYRVGAVSSTANSVLDLYGVRRERGFMYAQLFDSQRTTNGIYNIVQRGSNLLWAPSSTTRFGAFQGERRLLNYQLVPIPFSLANIPANATTELQMWGDTALALGTPRIGPPWGGSIVGMSYRLSAVPTGPAGSSQALRLQATVAGASVWTAHTLPATGATISGEATQAVGVDEFSAGQQLGVQAVTPSGYTPTSADLAVILWVALKYDGE